MIGWWVRMIAAVALVLLAAGCTGGDGDPPSSLPDLTPSSTASQTPDSTPTPAEPEPTPTGEAPPEPRDGMHENTQAGVDAFTRYVIDVINYSYRTNDVSVLQELSTNDCQFCANAVEGLTFITSEGGRIEGGELVPTTERFDIIGPAEGFETSAGVPMVANASQTIDGDEEVRSTDAEREVYFIFAYAREDDTWKLVEVRNAPGQ